jgi:hypothetical protein
MPQSAEGGERGERGGVTVSSFPWASDAVAHMVLRMDKGRGEGRGTLQHVRESRQRAGRYGAEDGSGKRGEYGHSYSVRCARSCSRRPAGRGFERRPVSASAQRMGQRTETRCHMGSVNARSSTPVVLHIALPCRTRARFERRVIRRWRRWRHAGRRSTRYGR